MGDYEDFLFTVTGLSALYFVGRKVMRKVKSMRNNETMQFLSKLESDIEAEIERTKNFDAENILIKRKKLGNALEQLKKLDYKKQDFTLEEILPIYKTCINYRVGYFQDAEVTFEDD